MPQAALDPDTSQLLVGRLIYMLKALYEAEKIKNRGFESTSWQGQLAGFRCALEIIFGPAAAGEILEDVREETCRKLGEASGEALMKRGFPEVERGPGNPGYVYVALGQHEKALVEGHKALEKNPTSARRYAFLIGCYILLNRLSEARALLDEAVRKNIDSLGLRFSSYMLAFLSRDVIGMQEQVEWGTGKPGVEDAMLSLEANTRAFFGQLRTARDLSRRAVSSAELLGEKELAARYQVDAALREALFGNAVETRQWAESALRLSNGRNVQHRVALALAFAGDLSNAKSLVNGIGEGVPQETVIQFNYLPTLKAQVALSENDAFKAIEALQVASPYELGTLGKTTLYPVFVRGEAFLIAHQGKEAAAEFTKILDHPGIVLNGAIGVRGRLGLAQAYAKQGETAQAKAAYWDFLTMWKDADPDIPILKQAKGEYAKLQ